MRIILKLKIKNVNLETSYDRRVEGGTHICSMESSQFLSPKGWRRPISFFKEFKIKVRLNLRQHAELLRQFFEALIKNSPRLRGAPQVVQRLLD
jgi:hypothetical protein